MIKVYAIGAYVSFLAALLYFIGWLADVGVAKGISDGATGDSWGAALCDLGLLTIFALQHSVMARPWFKRASRVLIPDAAQRATYVLASTGAVLLLTWQWRPLNSEMWNLTTLPWRLVLWSAYAAGWLVVLFSTFMIGHFDLFGLKQALRGSSYVDPSFRKPGLYALVRHPIMTGFMIAFWATPRMTAGHLLFAAAATAYIVVAVRFEEHDLSAHLGTEYDNYASQTPRFVPKVRHSMNRSK